MPLQFSPEMVLDPWGTDDLNKVSNLAWSGAVMKDKRMFGIFRELLIPLLANELTKPVAVGFKGCKEADCCWE